MEIRLKHLTKTFPGNPKKNIPDTHAVEDMNLTVTDGKLFALLGPSGCGKSTTLYMIAGLLEPTSGEIWFGDEDVTALAPEKRGIGLVFQNYALYPHMTVYKNVAFPLTNLRIEEKILDKDGKEVLGPDGKPLVSKRRLSKDEIDKLVHETAKIVQIEEYLWRKPSQLSGGQQQRVAIARALVKHPRVLLLDEPLSNLDARLRLQTREEIRRIQQETGITTIFVTHDQEEAMSISDSLVVMKLGVKQQIGLPQDVYNEPDNRFVANFLGTPPINFYGGRIKGNKIYIGKAMVREITEKKIPNQDVTVGIRPEGIVIDPEGPLTLHVERILTMGRDIMLVASNPDELRPEKFVIDAFEKVGVGDVRVSIKPHKCFAFSKEGKEEKLI
ncbi:MAG: ABC transporter ATP-binding protein [Bacilli bacterium]|jgi:multiple sugar transport system ATP-binding protein|nr:ABC transporter ATP-binding protein [Bacilli bacterium]